jgi:hypothetical protein
MVQRGTVVMSNDAIRIPGGPSSLAVILEPILLQQVSGLSVDKEGKEKKPVEMERYAEICRGRFSC